MSITKDSVNKRIRCIEMNDERPVPSGTEGTITHVDDIGTIHVKWDNGSTLGLIQGEDKFVIIEKLCSDGLYEHCTDYYNIGCKGCPMLK